MVERSRTMMNEVVRKVTNRTDSKAPKRTEQQISNDRLYLQFLISENPNVTASEAFPLLLEHIKERGDEYTISRTVVFYDLQNARNEMIKHTRSNVNHHILATLADIEENILIATEEVQRRLTARQEETVEMEELSIDDFTNLTVEETFLLQKLKGKMTRKRIRVKKIRPGQDLKEAMDIVFMWIDAKRKLLGLDAPKKIHKKTEKEIRKETFSYTDLEKKMKDMGADTQKLKELFENAREIKNDEE